MRHKFIIVKRDDYDVFVSAWEKTRHIRINPNDDILYNLTQGRLFWNKFICVESDHVNNARIRATGDRAQFIDKMPLTWI